MSQRPRPPGCELLGCLPNAALHPGVWVGKREVRRGAESEQHCNLMLESRFGRPNDPYCAIWFPVNADSY